MSAAEAKHRELAWLDGRFLPRSELALPVGDAGFVLGATVTEQLRTFRGRLFLPDDHARRLAESLAIVGLVPAHPLDEILRAADHVAAHNQRLAAAAGAEEPCADLGLVIFVTPGDLAAQHGGRTGRPRTAVHSFPLAFPAWAGAYDHGVSLRTVSVRQVPDACWPLRAKVRSRMHYYLADREAHAAEPGARAVLAHADGRISETSTANIAIVRGGRVASPPVDDALAGVSLACARRLAGELGVAWEERSLHAADLAAADEILLTSTPSCVLPAARFDGRPVGTGRPGPVFRAILDSWSRLVGLDIAAQARSHAGPNSMTGPTTGPAATTT
jgi:branched-subunit amino acid aminotransferase/4-amino-4-deoxychorismate lyase